MAAGGACLPYGASFEGGILVSLVFLSTIRYPALNLRNIYRYRRFIVDYRRRNVSLDWLAAVQVLSWLAYPLADCCSI